MRHALAVCSRDALDPRLQGDDDLDEAEARHHQSLFSANQRTRPLCQVTPLSPSLHHLSPKIRSASTSGMEDIRWARTGAARQAQRLAGVYGNRSRRRPNPQPHPDSAQQLVLLYPNTPAYQYHPVLPTFPLAGSSPLIQHPYLAEYVSIPSVERIPLARRQDYVTVDDLQRPSFYPPSVSPIRRNLRSGSGGLGPARVYKPGTNGMRHLGVGRMEAGHYSDDSTFLPGLPRRVASQQDVKFHHSRTSNPNFNPASEFRPLGYYPHLTRPSRPTYLPLNSSPLPERPTSLCMMGGAVGSYSDSEPEVFYPYYCPPVLQGKVVQHPGLARMRFSSGSLQLDEQEEEGEEENSTAEEKTKKAAKGEDEEKKKAEGDEKKGATKLTKVTL